MNPSKHIQMNSKSLPKGWKWLTNPGHQQDARWNIYRTVTFLMAIPWLQSRLFVVRIIIYIKQNAGRMMRMGCNDDLEQENEQRVNSRRAHNHLKYPIKSDGAVPEIPDHVLEYARKSKDTNVLVGVILRWKKVRNEDNRDICPDKIKPKGYSNHNNKKDFLTKTKVKSLINGKVA